MAIEQALYTLFSNFDKVVLAMDMFLYTVAVFFYGGIAVKGLRSQKAVYKWPLMVLSGIICLLATSSLSPLFPFPKEMDVLKLAPLLAGLLTAALLSFSLNLMSHDSRVYTTGYLAGKLESLKAAALSPKGLKPISRDAAEELASGKVKGEVGEAKLSEGKWYVKIQQGGSARIVEIDALDGEVEKVYYHHDKLLDFLFDPKKALGLSIALILAFSILFAFKGLPSISDDFKQMGITDELLKKLKETAGANSDPGCMDSLKEMSSVKYLNDLPGIKNESLIRELQQVTGNKILSLYRLESSKGVAALTDGQKLCIFSRELKKCPCLEVRQA